MYVFHYHPTTGIYLGSSEAFESPLEPNVYLVPAHSTMTAPPDAPAGKIVVWDGSQWVLSPEPTQELTQTAVDPIKAARWDSFYQALLTSEAFFIINSTAKTDPAIAVDYSDCGFALTRASIGLVNIAAVQAALDSLLSHFVGEAALPETAKEQLLKIAQESDLSDLIAFNFPE